MPFSFPRPTVAPRSADDALRASDACFRAVFDSAPIGMALVGRTGRVIESNPRLRALLGYDADELQDLTFADFARGEVVERDAERFRELLSGRLDTYEIEGRFRHRDGEEFSARLTTASVSTQSGACALRMMEDVTARLRLEEQLRQSQKMEAIGRLAGGLAHDFNNLLTVIKGYADGLVEDLAPHPKWRSEADAIREAATRAAGLTTQLLAFGRKQHLKLQPLNLNTIVTGVEVLLSRLIPASIDLRVKTAGDLGAVRADATQLEQVIINLAVNARDAMPRGGVLAVTTSNIELDDAYSAKHIGVKPGGYVMLTVSDTGAGMDEATRARIFEPFFTTKGQGRGTGLGLATVFGIVRQSGGNVWVYSEVGTGTTFKVYLPRVAQAIVEPHSPAEHGTVAGGQETVLLVEDQEAVRELLASALRRAGYHVIEAHDGEQALAVIDGQLDRVAALVTDVVMPKLSGPDLYRRLLAMRPSLKVVFMSGYAEDHVKSYSVDGESAFLEKPFSPLHLTRKLRDLLDHAAEQKYAAS